VNQKEFFTEVLKILEKLHIPYMISGSVGSMLYGEPRMTNDIDIVVELKEEKIEDFLNQLDEMQYYFPSLEFVKDSVKRKSQFNIIHLESGSKVDIIIKKSTEFAEIEFSRKRQVAFTENFDAFTASPEDIIISKMAFYHLSGSEKHIKDIASMLIISSDEIDHEYLGKWISKMGYQDIWSKVQDATKF
jgi:predicted nucleotidyltransferase